MDFGDIDTPTIQTGDIKQAEFTVNRYVVNDGEVEHQEESVDITEDEMDELREDIASQMDDAMAEFEQTGDVSGTRLDLTMDDPDPAVDTQDTASPESGPEESEQDGQQAEQDQDDPQASQGEEPADALATAREIAQDHDIDKTDYPVFGKHVREAGIDNDSVSDLWDELREEGVIDGDDADSEDSDQPAVEEPDADVPDAVYLITTEGCMGCEMLKDDLGDLVDDPVEVLDIQESDEAVDIVMELDIDRTPTMVEERDGAYERL
jgi:hypothetical protein